MKIKKILKLLLTALFVVISLIRLIRRRKKQRNTKKLETIVILQVSIEAVLPGRYMLVAGPGPLPPVCGGGPASRDDL